MAYDAYDTMQVCMNGHRITSGFEDFPEHNKAFCPDCGEPTIIACPACKSRIKGHLRDSFSISVPQVPSFCDTCGMAYPWKIAGVANALEVLRLAGFDEADVQEVERNLPDITRDTPRTQAAVLRVRKTLGKAGKPLYDIGVKVIGDIAVAAVKSRLGL
jgi:hypothetical protein